MLEQATLYINDILGKKGHRKELQTTVDINYKKLLKQSWHNTLEVTNQKCPLYI